MRRDGTGEERRGGPTRARGKVKPLDPTVRAKPPLSDYYYRLVLRARHLAPRNNFLIVFIRMLSEQKNNASDEPVLIPMKAKLVRTAHTLPQNTTTRRPFSPPRNTLKLANNNVEFEK